MGRSPGVSMASIGRSSRPGGKLTVVSMSSVAVDAANYIPAAPPILVPEGPWQQIPGGVIAAKGFKAAGIYGGLRAQGEKPDLALVTCDVDAISAGVCIYQITHLHAWPRRTERETEPGGWKEDTGRHQSFRTTIEAAQTPKRRKRWKSKKPSRKMESKGNKEIYSKVV